MITNEELDEMEAIEKAATAGPWPLDYGIALDEESGDYVYNSIGPAHQFKAFEDDAGFQNEQESKAEELSKRDSIFIAASRDFLPRAIEEIRRLQKVISKQSPKRNLEDT